MKATRTDITVNGRSYTIFQRGERLQVIRLGYSSRGDHHGLSAPMIEIAPRVTSGRQREGLFVGDTREVRASVS